MGISLKQLSDSIAQVKEYVDTSSGETYSTEEAATTRKYIDNKTIYRRFLQVPLDGTISASHRFIIDGVDHDTSGTTYNIDVNEIIATVDLSAWNIDICLNVTGHCTHYKDTTRATKQVDIPYPSTFNSNAYITGWYTIIHPSCTRYE